MRVLCVGDVVSKKGCEFVNEHLRGIKCEYNIDFTVVNGENSSDGNGVTPASAKMLFESGADVITLGNHTFARREIYPYLDENEFILRPANFPAGTTPGRGMGIYDLGKYRVAVINIMGTVYLEALDNPFDVLDNLLEQAKKETRFVVCDIHAEATAEKRALAFYADGRASAVFGTHTHIQTADACVLPGGTGYITDVGMCGPVNSVLGVKPELAIAKMKNKLPVRFETAEGEFMINAVVFDLDDATGMCKSAHSIIVK